MKILIKTLPKKINFKNINEYNIKTANKKYIYSLEGIYCLYNDTFKKIIVEDESYTTTTINNIELICDNTRISYKVSNKLPFHYKEENVTIYTYAVRKNSPITFHIEMIEDKIKDMYFITHESTIEHFFLKQDIQFFLNTL